jgi:hypothetical protein
MNRKPQLILNSPDAMVAETPIKTTIGTAIDLRLRNHASSPPSAKPAITGMSSGEFIRLPPADSCTSRNKATAGSVKLFRRDHKWRRASASRRMRTDTLWLWQFAFVPSGILFLDAGQTRLRAVHNHGRTRIVRQIRSSTCVSVGGVNVQRSSPLWSSKNCQIIPDLEKPHAIAAENSHPREQVATEKGDFT